jgi:hypothetical protein
MDNVFRITNPLSVSDIGKRVGAFDADKYVAYILSSFLVDVGALISGMPPMPWAVLHSLHSFHHSFFFTIVDHTLDRNSPFNCGCRGGLTI